MGSSLSVRPVTVRTKPKSSKARTVPARLKGLSANCKGLARLKSTGVKGCAKVNPGPWNEGNEGTGKHENQTLNECDYEYQYNQQMGRCYKVHVVEQTWTRAYEMCAYEGGHLVILNDEEEANIVKSMFPVNEGIQFHIGLRAWGADRIWTTIHGESIQDVFNHWNTSQPDNWYGNQDRATYLRNGYMDDVQPWTVAMFVCEKSPK